MIISSYQLNNNFTPDVNPFDLATIIKTNHCTRRVQTTYKLVCFYSEGYVCWTEQDNLYLKQFVTKQKLNS